MEPQRQPPWDYPAEDDLGETLLHMLIRTLLFELVRRHLAQRAIRALTGSDQFVYWVEGNPHKTVAPDLYVVLGADPNRDVRVWKIWEEGSAPQFALEIVSDDVQKDYVLAPMRYAEMGVEELVVFDPMDRDGRVRWQLYRRTAAGDLVLHTSSNDDRIRSAVLDCHLRWVLDPQSGQPRVRLGVGPQGDQLVRTGEEAERAGKEAERAGRQAERVGREAERAGREAERARRLALEAEVAALKRRLKNQRDD